VRRQIKKNREATKKNWVAKKLTNQSGGKDLSSTIKWSEVFKVA